MLWLPKLFGIRTIATIHGLDWQRSKWGDFASKMLKLGEKIAAKWADEVIVLSKNVQDYFRETYGRETMFITNGINKTEKKTLKEIKERFGLEENGYILFLARIVPEKGAHYLIEAFKQLDTDKKLVIAGGSSHSFEYREQIQKSCEGDDRIIMTGFVQGEALEELYSNAWIYALPSDVEGMALTLLEAMSYGNACLVSDIPENMEVIENCGFFFEKSNVEDLRAKLEYLLLHEDKLQKIRERSSDFICKKYDWDHVVERTVELYEKKAK